MVKFLVHFYIFMLQRPNIIKRCESLKLSTKSYVYKKFQNEDKDIKIFLMERNLSSEIDDF